MWWTVIAALAAPPGFQHVKDVAGCELSQGPTEADGVTPMLAACHWPEVDPARLSAMLARFDRYADYIAPVQSSEVVRQEGERALVHQLARTRGIAPREVLLWMEAVPVEGGGTRYTWTSDATLPLELQGNHVRAPRNDGWWEVAPHPEGGARVGHFVAYDPGGSVPDWIVRWAQTGGLSQVMSEMRAYAREHAPLRVPAAPGPSEP